MGVLGGPLGGRGGKGGPGGDRGGLGGIEGIPGRFWRGPGGPLEKVIFFFCVVVGAFVDGLAKSRYLQFLSVIL